jgi:hypothetical protein
MTDHHGRFADPALSEKFIGSSLRDLAILRDCKRKRSSSWDRTGGNNDSIIVPKGQTVAILEVEGAGCITHLWSTIKCEDKYHLRKILLRMSWDDEVDPSVEAPVGDFFGMGHAMTRNFVSAPLAMSPQDGKALNCFFPMPFSKSAKIEVTNESGEDAIYFFYVDYEEYDRLPDNLGRFHAMWHRENPCKGMPDSEMTLDEYMFGGTNLSGDGNYVILEAEGRGHYVGCNLNIHNLGNPVRWNWYGEGDDMIFIDGDRTPTINGTGTEDYFNTAWCPNQVYHSPYHGIILPGGPNWSGKITLYRYHIQDPIQFQKSIKVTIEHGHANRRSDDYSSTAYWYQTEPHKRFPKMLAPEQRLPREDEHPSYGSFSIR